MVIVSCDSFFVCVCYLYFPLLKCFFVSDFFRLVNIFLGELGIL